MSTYDELYSGKYQTLKPMLKLKIAMKDSMNNGYKDSSRDEMIDIYMNTQNIYNKIENDVNEFSAFANVNAGIIHYSINGLKEIADELNITITPETEKEIVSNLGLCKFIKDTETIFNNKSDKEKQGYIASVETRLADAEKEGVKRAVAKGIRKLYASGLKIKADGVTQKSYSEEIVFNTVFKEEIASVLYIDDAKEEIDTEMQRIKSFAELRGIKLSDVKPAKHNTNHFVVAEFIKNSQEMTRF